MLKNCTFANSVTVVMNSYHGICFAKEYDAASDLSSEYCNLETRISQR